MAFLVQTGEHQDIILDAIFADCYSRWGGRFSLIIPCENNKILPEYWTWLEAYDPDFVYSYAPLSREDILEIHERLAPSLYFFHKKQTGEQIRVFDYKPDYKIQPLSSLSNIFRLARYSSSPTGEGAPVKIIDSWYTEKPTRLITDNLGTYHFSTGTGMYPPDAKQAAELLTIVAAERQANRQMGIPKDILKTETELAALKEFSTKRATSLSLLSAQFAPKLDISSNDWSTSFTLVLGHTFEDRILFWNSRLFIPSWLDNDLSGFIVTLEQLRDVTFLEVFGELLKFRNHVNNGTGGQAEVTIRSISHNIDDLKEAQKLIQGTKPWGIVRVKAHQTLTELIPNERDLKSSREGNRFGSGFFTRPDWHQFVWTDNQARPPILTPDHLADAPVRQSFTQGYWPTDFIFECDGPGPRYSEINRWTLPKRWRIARAFRSTLVGNPNNAYPPPKRRSRNGCLAIFNCVDYPIETIRIPSPFEALAYAFTRDGDWAKSDGQHNDAHPLPKAFWIKPSNEARYLAGVTGLTGGIVRAADLLLHPFLQKIFFLLGGSPVPPQDKIIPTVNSLRKRAPNEPVFDLKDELDQVVLANLVVKAARSLKKPFNFLKYSFLKEAWKAHREEFWAKQPARAVARGNEDIDWDKREEESLEDCLIELRRRQMVFQGHQWICKKCHHKNWIDFSKFTSKLICEVCSRPVSAPIDVDWLFRGNEFLLESLRDRSTLSLIWVLEGLRQRARESFIYVDPTWFGYSDSEDPDAEADLLVSLDGKTYLCEVKSSWTVLRISDLETLEALAKRLRPDVAILAVMEDGLGPTTEIEKLKRSLQAESISFELITTKQFKFRDDCYLPFDGEV